MYTTLYIGPVQAIGYNLDASWKSAASAQHARAFSLKGAIEVAAAEQLSELVANPDRRSTIGAFTGVLDYVFMNGGIARDFNGWALLESFDFNPYRLGDQARFVNFTVDAANLGPHRQVVIVHTDRALDDDFSLTAKATLTDPFVTDGLVRSPGGTLLRRDYDPLPTDPDRTSTDAYAQMAIYVAGVGTLAAATHAAP